MIMVRRQGEEKWTLFVLYPQVGAEADCGGGRTRITRCCKRRKHPTLGSASTFVQSVLFKSTRNEQAVSLEMVEKPLLYGASRPQYEYCSVRVAPY